MGIKDLPGRLAYLWDLQAKRIKQTWLPAVDPPSSFRVIADRVEEEKKAALLRFKKRRGIIK